MYIMAINYDFFKRTEMKHFLRNQFLIGFTGSKAYKEILKILEAAKKRNLLAGIHNGGFEYAQKMISKGFNLVTIGSDQRFLSSGAKTVIEKIKGTKKVIESKGY